MPDFGLGLGLAYRHNWGQEMQNKTNLYLMNKQAKIDQENKAKLLTDDLKFGSANNKWDQAIIKSNSENQIHEIGKFASENPDWTIDPEKRAKMLMLKNNMINNEDVSRGMRVDTHYANLMKYVQDPKNALMLNDPAVKDAIASYARYSATGSASMHPEEKKEFMWVAPEELVDTEGIVQKYAAATTRDQTVHGGAGLGAYRQLVSNSNKDKVADSLLSNANHGKYLVSDYNRLSPDQQKQFGGVKGYVMSRMQPYFPQDEIHEGHIFRPSDDGSSKNKDAIDPFHRDIWGKLISSNDPNYRVKYPPSAMDLINKDADGQIDLRNAEFSWNGKDIRRKDLGIRKAFNVGDTGKRTAPDGSVYMSNRVGVDFDKDEFIDLFGNSAINYRMLNNIIPGDDFDDFDIHPEYRTNIQKVKGADGKGKVRVFVDQQVVNTQAAAALYRKAAHGKSEGFSNVDGIEGKIGIAEDGSRWIQYSDGRQERIE